MSYKTASNKIFGRYLIATKDIKQGELILKESPIIVGPTVPCIPLCLKCFKALLRPSKRQQFCPKCKKAPVCKASCSGGNHPAAECAEFSSNPFITAEKLLEFPQSLTALRCLLLRKAEPKFWGEFLRMEAHLEQRRNTPIWRNYKLNVEPALRQFGLVSTEDQANEIVQKVCGILDVNSFELRIPGVIEADLGQCVRGVYVEAALMAHDCVGNTHLAVDDHFSMTVHASLPIKKGSAIFFNYTNALQGTWDRQSHLTNGKYFSCSCKRCSDPTELRTYTSSIKCVKCRQGLVSPIKKHFQQKTPTFAHAPLWQCGQKTCNFTYHGTLVKSAITAAQQLIEQTDKSDLELIEALIGRLECTFPATHALVLDLKQTLVGLYSEALRAQPTSADRNRWLAGKLRLCEDLLPTLTTIEPGISRLVAITLYEMHGPLMVLANRDYDNNLITINELMVKLQHAENTLKKAISYLIYEPHDSPEGRLAARAITELKQLRKNTGNLQKIACNS